MESAVTVRCKQAENQRVCLSSACWNSLSHAPKVVCCLGLSSDLGEKKRKEGRQQQTMGEDFKPTLT